MGLSADTQHTFWTSPVHDMCYIEVTSKKKYGVQHAFFLSSILFFLVIDYTLHTASFLKQLDYADEICLLSH